MSARRQYSDKHSLPLNPSWVDFPRSDGDQNQWPTNTTREVDFQGHVNYMRPVGLDEPGVSVKWRIEVGAAIAVLLKWPEGPSYVLKDWPKGYRMYDHLKGPDEAPRHDIYLFGSKARYRSVPEFIPHALWLMEDATLDRSNCKCKYCSKKTQREITSTMTFLPKTRNTPTSGSPGPSRFPKSRGKARVTQPYAAVQRMPKPIKQHSGLQNPVLRERNNDLRAAYSKSSMKLKRWFREGELLWCYLDQPIRGSNDGVEIMFWPGLVQEVKLKTDAIPRTADGPEIEGSDDDGSPVPWTVHQSTVYKMKLLAISHTYSVSDDMVLPYQAYFPSSDLIVAIQELLLGKMDLHLETIADFNPCPPTPSGPNSASGFDNPALFVDAAAPYSIAVQIASKLATYWCLTDEWDFKYAVPPRNATTTARPEQAPSLQSVLMAAGSQNAMPNSLANPGSISSGPSGYRNISGPSNGMSEADLYSLGTRILGPPAQPAQTVTQTRYQGLWWGAERIWTDELVRVKLVRRQLAPEGAPDIYPPAGPSQKTLEYNAQLLGTGDVSEADLGAGGRGVFMKLEGLFLVDIPREDGSGMRKECRASGMLYELADEDWPDPYAEAHEQFALEKEKQKSAASLSFRPSGHDANGANGPASSSQQSPNDALSHPVLSTPYPIPTAPTGFKFRPILTPGHEAVLTLTLISGRYYPRILVHPLLQSAVQRMYTNSLEEGGLHQGKHLWALEGLSPGYFNAVDPKEFKPSRIVMMRDADREARIEVDAGVREREQKVMEVPDPEMQDELQPGYMDVDVVEQA